MIEPTDLSRQKLVRVFSTHSELEARMVQELLRNAGIESLINAEVPPSLFPLNLGDMANEDLLVLESEAEEARRIIAEQHEAGDADDIEW